MSRYRKREPVSKRLNRNAKKDRDHWKAVMNTVINPPDPTKDKEFLDYSRTTTSFYVLTLCYGAR